MPLHSEIVSQTIDFKTSVSMKSTIISRWEWLGKGNYNMSSEVKRYTDVTREDVIRVYNKYIKNRKAVISTVKPKNPFATKKDSLVSFNPNANLILSEDLSAPDYTYVKGEDDFDRSIQPTAGNSKAPTVPEYYNATLSNGINIIGTESSEVPKVYLRLTIGGGALVEDVKRVGLADFTAEMMNESTLDKTTEQMSVALRTLGSSIRFSSDDEATYMYIESLTKNLDATLKLAEEKLLKPAFNDEDFKEAFGLDKTDSDISIIDYVLLEKKKHKPEDWEKYIKLDLNKRVQFLDIAHDTQSLYHSLNQLFKLEKNENILLFLIKLEANFSRKSHLPQHAFLGPVAHERAALGHVLAHELVVCVVRRVHFV